MISQLNHHKLTILYSSLLAWIPLLNIYRLLPGISIGETLLVFFTIAAFISNGVKRRLNYGIAEVFFLIFLLYSAFSTVFNFLLNLSFDFFWLNRIIRFLFYGICVLFTSNILFNKNVFFKSFNIAAIVVFLGILFQYVVYYGTGQYIVLYEYLFPLNNEILAERDYLSLFEYSVFRPCSFFTEPSHVAQYFLFVLIYDLFSSDFMTKNKKLLIQVVIICSGILLTKSLWGYFLLLVLAVVLFLFSLKRKHNVYWYILTPILLLITSLVFFNSSLFADTFSRIDLFNLGNSAAFTGRFGKYDLINTEDMAKFIFGSGFGITVADIRAYPNSIVFILLGDGIIGLVLLGLLYLFFMLTTKVLWKRVMSSVFYMLMFGETIIFSILMILVFSCLFNKDTSISECSQQ